MEIELHKEQIQNYCRLFSQLVTREETIEAVVPDVMPDVQQIMDTDAQVYLRGKETEEGRLSIHAFLEGTVLYLPEGENGLRRLTLSGNFSFSFDDPAIPRDCVTQLTLRCTAADARMLNPRKVLLRAEITAEAAIYSPCTTEYASGAEGEGLQILQRKATVAYIAAVEEKTFVIAEDFSLPGGVEAGEILRSRVWAETEDLRLVAGKLIVQGTVHMELLYCSEGAILPQIMSFSTSFSQILDVHGEHSGPCAVELMPTACYVEALGGAYGAVTVSMELHLVAQACCAGERELEYLADAYSNHCPCRVHTAELSFSAPGRRVSLRETVREMVECPEAVTEVLCCTVVPGRAAADEGKVKVPLNVRLLCRGERGGIVSVNRRLWAECNCPPCEGSRLLAALPRCLEPYAAVASGALELRIPVEVELQLDEAQELTAVADLVPDAETVVDTGERPSVTVVKRGEADLWSLAKKYGSTLELIAAANPNGGEDSLFLLIPRCR